VSWEWSKVHLLRVWASSGTRDRLSYGISCYSWWLPPPRWLGTAGSLSEGSCLSLAPIVVIVRGSCAFPMGDSLKATLVDCSWLVYPHLVLVLTAPLCRVRHVKPISAWATKWVCCHNVDQVAGKQLTHGINHRVINWYSCDWFVSCPVWYTSLLPLCITFIYLV
jgi:hypothetical protein